METIDNGEWIKFDDISEFDNWCTEGGWEGSGDFTKDTRITFSEIRGRFFNVVHSRVYLKED